MAKMNKKRRAYAEKQQKQGQNTVKWIFAVLVVLALACAFYYINSFS